MRQVWTTRLVLGIGATLLIAAAIFGVATS
jgi:hypothetical protein